MEEDNVKALITFQRITNQLLGAVDSAKHNKDVRLDSILNQLYAPYDKVDNTFRDSHHFLNQYQLISSLYTYIVLPKESLFELMPETTQTCDLADGWGINKLGTFDMKYFLRRLRNSVSHGGIDFDNNGNFKFVDKNPRDSKDVFEITMSSHDLLKFTQALAYWCITKDMTLSELKET